MFEVQSSSRLIRISPRVKWPCNHCHSMEDLEYDCDTDTDDCFRGIGRKVKFDVMKVV